MTQLDEARYGRMSLLVLNICPATLRRTIEQDYTRQGYADFADFLESKKHQIFHLMRRQCCCRPAPSASTPLNRSQWDLLFTRCSTPLPHRHQGECPCQYTAIAGISCDVMDITLCCLIIRNLCPGVNLADVGTIREARNKLIHSDSGASLDEPAFNAAWGSVEGAVLSLARSVSPSLEADTKTRLQELKDRIMNPSDLAALKSLIVDEKKVDQLAQDVEAVIAATARTTVTVAQHSEQLTNQQQEIRELRTAQKKQGQHTDDFPEEKINQLREILYEHNRLEAQSVPVSPLQKSAKDLPVDLIYAPVSIREDLEDKSTKKSDRKDPDKDDKPEDESNSKPKSKPVNTPGDMFYKNGKPARFVFMRGEAGRGKTVYCLRLMQYWCTAKEPGKDKNTLTDWEKGVDKYGFLFRVSLRHVNRNRTSLVDMICHDMFKHHPECHKAIRHVLSNDKYRILVVLDGLDEWKISPKAFSKLTNPGFPNIEAISNTTYFTTSRPWKLEEVDVSVRKDETTRIIEIHGLDEKGVKLVIEKVLVNFYDMKSDSQEYQTMFQKILENTQNEKYKSLMEIPLLVTACVQLWCEGSEVGDSMTSFYIDLVSLLIRRAYNAKQNYQTIKEKLNKKKSVMLSTPAILQENRTLADFIVVLCTLGDVAYQDLVSQETNLVFQKYDLEEKVGQTEIEFALKAGLLSQTEAPGKVGREHVSFSFFHKSMQEFLTAVKIVCRDKVGIESLFSHISSVKQIMDLSNVIMFTSGLSPSLGSILSQHIVSVTDKDVDVCKYRETFPDHDYDLQNKVLLLYGVQVSCYQEMKHNVSTSGSSLQDITYHVADVYVDRWSDTETQRVTGELLCDHHVNIKSLCVDDDVDINDSINTFLHNTTSLQHLCIWEINLHSINDQFHSLKTLHLDRVTLSPDAVCGLQKSLQNNTVLQSLTLGNITCRGESGEKIEITLSLNSMPTSLQHLCISGKYGSNINLHSISDQLHSLKTLHLEWVTLSPDDVCGLQKSLQNNTVLQSLRLGYITCRGESGEKIEITLSLNSMLTSLQHLCISGDINLHSISDQFHSLKTLHLECVTLSPDAVCGLQKSLQNNTVLQSLTLGDITCRGESGEEVPASLCDVLRVLPDSLTTLDITGLKYKEDIMMLVDVLPRLHHLHSVEYYGEVDDDGTYRNAECHAAVAQTLSCMKQLQHLQLGKISLGDRSLELTSEMSQIEEVWLWSVKMSAGGWNKFVHSLINIPHHFVVTLIGTVIDDESRTMIRSSPCFTVTRDDGRSWLLFTRVAPSTQCTGKQ